MRVAVIPGLVSHPWPWPRLKRPFGAVRGEIALVKTYDGHGQETVSKPKQGDRLPCCRESATGVCPQHVDNHMAHLQYDLEYEWATPPDYYRARNRAAARMNREMRAGGDTRTH